MNFIELTLKSNEKALFNVKLIESVEQFEGEIRLRTQGDEENYYPVIESYSEVMAKIHKVKRLEIASKLAGMIYECGFQKVTCEAVSKRALEFAEELIKQNEKME
jgi:hypothetical protein